jgi:hypothetical protein
VSRESFTSSPSRIRGEHVEPARFLGWSTYKIVADPFGAVGRRLQSRTLAGEELTRKERRAWASSVIRTAPGLSDRRVAELCGVSHQTVGRLRSGLDHPAGVRNAVVEPNPTVCVGGGSYDLAMATVEAEREMERPASVRVALPLMRGAVLLSERNLPRDASARRTILARRAKRLAQRAGRRPVHYEVRSLTYGDHS